MASYSAARAKHATLSGSTPDVVQLTGTFARVEVVNRSATVFLYVKVSQGAIDASVASSAGDDTIVIPPYRVLTEDLNGVGPVWLALAGLANPYSVQGVPE